jgi:hypothetical protein
MRAEFRGRFLTVLRRLHKQDELQLTGDYSNLSDFYRRSAESQRTQTNGSTPNDQTQYEKSRRSWERRLLCFTAYHRLANGLVAMEWAAVVAAVMVVAVAV